MGFSLGTVRQWHWISASVCMAGMLLFAVTGITLNHAADIPAQPTFNSLEEQVPDVIMQQWLSASEQPQKLSVEIEDWLYSNHQIVLPSHYSSEWDGTEFYLPLPRPGGDAWLALDAETGEFVYEDTDRGWLAYFNDLHKGRDSGTVWRWFIDIFAGGCIIFSGTGLILLWRQSSHRQSTAPLAALGVLIPLVLMLLFIH
ncbi:PepSY-associated TM helix domain-containing protein [Aliiglaciecola sp. 2_MG-2023]|uniref:PepSY-associated TM helix domain-containing protein n=1 Tax=unclassified Aliiglaciecola TaxID=2593648 RepID=UPI0026E332E9|nr:MULTISPECIES: PepSY-associated TM helix domain-containing protein [unclassified Aliiglaciecola]MDO6709779.1 PepSY-associated TM helix domain-containing protein [Aliiglaciecola sp. 2_MG-2023]MDO6750679.1 PepSY-associated TM helix domain-containing protein [Aliiglaciecola sp. 1_MG-2023]